jgi:hypothetical protein
MTGKPLSSRYSVVDSHSSTSSAKQKPAEAGFYMKVVKLTGKPLSFRCSVVDSHSSTLSTKQNPAWWRGS